MPDLMASDNICKVAKPDKRWVPKRFHRDVARRQCPPLSSLPAVCNASSCAALKEPGSKTTRKPS